MAKLIAGRSGGDQRQPVSGRIGHHRRPLLLRKRRGGVGVAGHPLQLGRVGQQDGRVAEGGAAGRRRWRARLSQVFAPM